MIWRRTVSLAAIAMLVVFALACGHSEEEWQAKLKENQELTNQLNAEKAAHKKSDADLEAAQGQVDQLKTQLKKLGLDLSNLNADYAEQKDALDKLRKDKEQLEVLRKRFEALKQKLDSLAKLGLSVTVRKNRMTIQLPGDVLFDSGRIDLKKEGKEILRKVADVIRNDKDLLARSFQVAGHTDNVPLPGGVFRDNWGLSLMRAREVLTFLIAPDSEKAGAGGGGLPADHWSAAGYGETDPIVPNDTAAGKQKNRRVELVVVPNVEEMLDIKSIIMK